MSNHIHVSLPVWMGPTTAAHLVHELLGGAATGVHCRPTPLPATAAYGCSFDVLIPAVEGVRSFFFHMDSDAGGRRLITTSDCAFCG